MNRRYELSDWDTEDGERRYSFFFERKRKGGDITNEPNIELTPCADVKSVNPKKRKGAFRLKRRE